MMPFCVQRTWVIKFATFRTPLPAIMIPTVVGKYTIKGPLGEGAFSTVRLAVDPETKIKYACKVIEISRMTSPDLQTRFENEVRIMQQMYHPNVVQLCDLIKDEHNYYVFTEYCPEGELFQYILDKKYIPEPEAKGLLIQLVNGLKYLHSHRIAHRDLKPENLLLGKNMQLKISDFGFARYVSESDNLAKTTCGSPCYSSPEAFSGKPYDAFKSDVWSIGVILYAMTTGQLPWKKATRKRLFAQIRAGDYEVPRYLSEELTEAIHSLMRVNPDERPTLDQILEFEWLKEAETAPVSEQKLSMVSLRTVDRMFQRDDSEIHGMKLTRSLSSHRNSSEEVMRDLTFSSDASSDQQTDDDEAHATPMSPLVGGPVHSGPRESRMIRKRRPQLGRIKKVCSLQSIFSGKVKPILPKLNQSAHLF